MRSKPAVLAATAFTVVFVVWTFVGATSTSSLSAAQLLLLALQNPAPTSTTTPSASTAMNAPQTVTIPIGVSLSSMGTNNTIIPQAVTTMSSAATTTNASLLQSLLAEVKVLETQIAALEGKSATTSALTTAQSQNPTACTPITLTGEVSLGSKGSEVTALQQFLEVQGFYTYPSVTGFFGPVTETAVEAFQKANGVVSSGTASTTGYGLVGPKTMAKIKALSSACTPTTTTTQASATTTATATPGLIEPIIGGYGGGGGGSGGGGGGGGGGSSDTTPPGIPTNFAATVASSTEVNLSWTASTDNVAVANYKVFRNGAQIAAPSGTTYNDTGLTPNTAYSYTVLAVDTSNNDSAQTSPVVATTSADVTPPAVSLTAPSSGATVSGTSVALTSTASDNVAVQGVQFKVDGTTIGSAITSSPYTTTWNSTGVADGSHTLSAVAVDTSGNYATSSTSFTVENTPVSISSISSGTPTTTAATITWTTNENASSTVAYGTTTGYGSASSSASFVTSHSIILLGLTASTTYHFQVQATNAAGNYATSSDQTFTTASTPDTTPPTAPTNLTAVAASLSELDLSWTASNDNGGGDSCCSYKIYRDGSQVGTTTSGSTYADTGLTASSTHAYIVKAYDAAGNVSSASNVATSTTGVWADGFAGAPVGGNVQYSNFFTSRALQSGQTYATRPPWRVAGVDYPVGIPSATVLQDPSTATLPAGCSYSANNVTCNGSGNLTINGYDFSLHNCIYLDIYGFTGTITIENNNFAMGSSTACQSQYGLLTLEGSTNGSSLIVQNNVFNDNAPTFPTLSNYLDVWDPNRSSGTSLYQYNAFLASIGRPLETGSSGNWTAQYNYFEGINYGNATHGEIDIIGSTGTNVNFTSEFNTSLMPANYGGGATSIWYVSSGSTNGQTFGTVNLENNTNVTNLFGGSGGTVVVSTADTEFAYNPVMTANILNNYVDPTGAFFCYVNSTTATTTNMTGNINLTDGSTISDFTQANCHGHH